MKAAIPPLRLDMMLRGEPERIVHATAKPRILITWMHTNEELAPRLMHYIGMNRPDLLAHVDYICGNPKAAATVPEAGFTETDLNRSFIMPELPKSYEEHRAVEVKKFIEDGAYDFILDVHTSVTSVGYFMIVSIDQVDDMEVRQMIAASPIKRVVVMPVSISRRTLLGAVRPALAIEYSDTIAETQGLQDALVLLEGIAGGKPMHEPFEREFFYIDGTVPKNEDPGVEARNFELCDDGYYPVLLGTGPRSYREDPTKDYVCFRAGRRTTETL